MCAIIVRDLSGTSNMIMVCAMNAVKDVNKMITNQLITNKVTLLIDDAWLTELISKMVSQVDSGEILQILENVEVNICADCQEYETIDGEVIMDTFKCDQQQEYCLNCCGCDEHAGEAWY
jgi:hypothetical protein